MIKKFSDKPYNKPAYEGEERDIARADMVYGILTGRTDELSKGKIFKDWDMRYMFEDRVIKYEIKVPDFD